MNMISDILLNMCFLFSKRFTSFGWPLPNPGQNTSFRSPALGNWCGGTLSPLAFTFPEGTRLVTSPRSESFMAHEAFHTPLGYWEGEKATLLWFLIVIFGICPLVMTNIAVENGHLYWVFLENNVIFHSDVSLPEAIIYLPLPRKQNCSSTYPLVINLAEKSSN